MPLLQQVNYEGCEFLLLDLTVINPVGNKYFKLKRNLEAAREQGFDQILTFGGAWSNHVHALSQVGPELGFKTTAVIRGERPKHLNPPLSEALENGMRLHFVSREVYRHRDTPVYLEALSHFYGAQYLLPEGGTNQAGIEGAGEIVDLLAEHGVVYDDLVVPLGTGGTMAGIAAKLAVGKTVTGICVLKGAEGIFRSIKEMIPGVRNWMIDHDGHCGGYARCPEDLKEFILDFEDKTGIPLEPVYSGKMMYRLMTLLRNDRNYLDRQVVAIHTGGLQGRRGFDF
ncbi:MAG: 1-aminocyclopropane-1-carboxylate deaminase [Candidatus Azotimanducaceae bacterium]|jgi:1-aminocyclopropane-1-carboxylate deaminase